MNISRNIIERKPDQRTAKDCGEDEGDDEVRMSHGEVTCARDTNWTRGKEFSCTEMNIRLVRITIRKSYHHHHHHCYVVPQYILHY
jgi:hypothetical protein